MTRTGAWSKRAAPNEAWLKRLAFLICAGLVGSCADPPPKTPKTPSTAGPAYYAPVELASLPGWETDTLDRFAEAFGKSCARLIALPDARKITPGGVAGTAGQWKPSCRKAAALGAKPSTAAVRAFVASRFKAYRVFSPAGDTGKFTGYYEIELNGSFGPGRALNAPAYARPPDLVMAPLGAFAKDLAGRRVSGRVKIGRLVPYDTRKTIEAADWAARIKARALFFGDPVDVFFLHVQGSGVVRFPDGSRRRVGYAADNGHKFIGIGRLLLDRKLIPRSEASAQGVRKWLRQNPRRAIALMAENPRYIFFRFIDGAGPLGAMGAPLTPGRSLAVDPRSIPLGAPVWLDTSWPADRKRPFRRLMVAQDTGGAIKGAVRGDVYWGTGEAALARAGRMNQPGRFFLLIPKEIPVDIKPPPDPAS